MGVFDFLKRAAKPSRGASETRIDSSAFDSVLDAIAFGASCVIVFRVARPRASRGRVFDSYTSRMIAREIMPARSAWAWHPGNDIYAAVMARMKHVSAKRSLAMPSHEL